MDRNEFRAPLPGNPENIDKNTQKNARDIAHNSYTRKKRRVMPIAVPNRPSFIIIVFHAPHQEKLLKELPCILNHAQDRNNAMGMNRQSPGSDTHKNRACRKNACYTHKQKRRFQSVKSKSPLNSEIQQAT